MTRLITQTLDDAGVLASVGSTGDAYDNALAESFVDSFKTELIADPSGAPAPSSSSPSSNTSAGSNHDRLHEALGDLPPAEFEALYADQSTTNTISIKMEKTN